MTATLLAARPAWAVVLQWTLWLALMTAVMRWVGRTRERPAATHSPGTLAHPRSTLLIGLVCSGFFLACAVGSALLPGRSVETGAGSPLTIDSATAGRVSPGKGRRPASISYSATPSDQRSVRWSILSLCSCSGHM